MLQCCFGRGKRMILYHTTDQEIRVPDIHCGRKNADFGWGFYLTPDRDFTYRWARNNAVVNKYKFDTTDLDIHRFTREIDWFRYIYDNRRLTDNLEADVIIGPIANDTIFDTLGIISSGFLQPEDALKLLMIGPEYTQVVLKSQKAADALIWLGSERIERENEADFKKEQESYQELFAAEMLKVVGS